MTDRSTRRAVEAIAESLQACLLCVTRQPTQLVPSLPEKNIYRLSFLPPGHAPHLKLSNGGQGVFFRVLYDISTGPIELKTPWSKASVVQYRADVGVNAISYHWHPTGLSRVIDPHVHIKSNFAPASETKPIGDLHLPTGVVSLAAIVRFLIEEIGVEPNRADWDTILRQIEAED